MPITTAVAIFAIDPGGTTGCAAGVFDLRRLTVAKVLGRAQAKGNFKTWNVTGDNVKQNWEIARAVTDYYYQMHVECRSVAGRAQLWDRNATGACLQRPMERSMVEAERERSQGLL
jgi:hypothetical protein